MTSIAGSFPLTWPVDLHQFPGTRPQHGSAKNPSATPTHFKREHNCCFIKKRNYFYKLLHLKMSAKVIHGCTSWNRHIQSYTSIYVSIRSINEYWEVYDYLFRVYTSLPVHDYLFRYILYYILYIISCVYGLHNRSKSSVSSQLRKHLAKSKWRQIFCGPLQWPSPGHCHSGGWVM